MLWLGACLLGEKGAVTHSPLPQVVMGMGAPHKWARPAPLRELPPAEEATVVSAGQGGGGEWVRFLPFPPHPLPSASFPQMHTELRSSLLGWQAHST